MNNNNIAMDLGVLRKKDYKKWQSYDFTVSDISLVKESY